MNDTDSQVNRLAEHFKQGGSITSYEAYVQFGITQLAARITELESRGVTLRRVPEKHNGKRYVRYSMGKL